MSDALDELVVRFRVDLDALTSGLGKAKELVGHVAEGIGEGFHKVGEAMLALTNPANLLRTFVAGELVKSFGELVYSSLESADALGKLADRLGVTTEGLAGLQFAAKMAGVEAESFAMSFRTAERVLSSAVDGNKQARDTFDQLGLSLRDLRQLNPEQQFSAYADAISHVENATDRARLAQELFGRSGNALLPMLKDGAAGLEAAKKEAAEFGLAISRVDAAKAEAAVDAIRKIGLGLQGIKQAIAIELAPVIAVMAEEIANATKQSGVFRDAFANASEVIIDKVAMVVNLVHGLGLAWDFVKVGFGYLMVAFQAGAQFIADGVLQWAGLFRNFGRVVADVSGLIDDAFAVTWAAIRRGGNDAIASIERGFADGLLAIGAKMAELGIKGSTAFIEAGYSISHEANKSAAEVEKAYADATAKAVADTAALKHDIVNVFNVDDMRAKNPFNASLVEARELLAQWKADLNRDAADPKPGNDLKRHMVGALNEVIKKADEAAEHIRAAQEPQGSKISDEEAQKRLDQLAKDLGDGTRAENEEYKKRLENLEALHDAGRISDEEYTKQREELERQHSNKIFDIHHDMENQKSEVDRFFQRKDVEATMSTLDNLATLMNSHNRKAFEIGKAAAIAQAVIGTAAGVAKTFEQLGWWALFGPAEAVAAAGAVQIANIQGTQFGGGSTGGVPGGGSISGGADLGPIGPQGATANNGAAVAQGSTIMISLPSDSGYLSTSAVRGLIEQINQAGADGTKINRIAISN